MMGKLLETRRETAPLVLRVLLGLVFFPHGAQKVLGWFGGYGLSGTLDFFTGTMGVPLALALLVIFAEFLGSLGLIVGFLTRIAAFGITCVMLGATVLVHWQNGFFMNWTGKQGGEGFEYHLLAIAIAVSLMISGGGRFSIDALLSRKGGGTP